MGAIGFVNNQLQVNGSPFQTGFKNYIINGNFDVWQRGTSFTPGAGGTYIADRWVGYGNSSMVFSAATSSNSGYYLNINYVNGEVCALGTRLECNGSNIDDYSNKTFTMTTKSYFNVAPVGGFVKWGVMLSHSGGVVDLIVGNATYTAGQNTVSVTFTIPNLSGYTLTSSSFIEFRPFYNFAQNNIPTQNIGIFKVQLEEGSVATPFEQRPIGLELSLCQRYYEKIRLRGRATSGFWSLNVGMLVQKRVTPTIVMDSIVTNETTSITDYSMYASTTDICSNWAVTPATTIPYIDAVFSASAEL